MLKSKRIESKSLAELSNGIAESIMTVSLTNSKGFIVLKDEQIELPHIPEGLTIRERTREALRLANAIIESAGITEGDFKEEVPQDDVIPVVLAKKVYKLVIERSVKGFTKDELGKEIAERFSPAEIHDLAGMAIVLIEERTRQHPFAEWVNSIRG